MTGSNRFAVDIGGTFTDLIAWDAGTRELRVRKTSTTAEPGDGVLEVLRKEGVDLENASLFVHGTTLGLNALLQGRGARTGLITTAGFRDVLEIGRIDRPHMYDILYEKPPPLVGRPLRLEVRERLDAKGDLLTPLSESDVLDAVEVFRKERVEAVAVCLLHSYANPVHEIQIGELLAREAPELSVTLSHRILREYYEYERTMSAVMNCMIQPIMSSYLDGLDERVRENGFAGTFLLLRSSGGAMSMRESKERPIHTLLSGPAGGVLGASHLGALTGYENLITGDGGGTSFDVSLIAEGTARVVSESEIGSYKLLLPVLDIRSIGAGGGSLAWVDAGGALRVGPESAGAHPGPICYGRGGRKPTVTDAALVLGLLNSENFLGGEMSLDVDGARRGIVETVAEPLGMTAEEAASGILAIAEAKMAGAIREISVERGFDPREFTLLGFGGSGPLVATNLARRSDIPRVLVPQAPANFSAWGMLTADLVHDFSRTRVMDLDELTSARADEMFSEMEALGHHALDAESIPPELRRAQRSLDLRYFGQGGHTVSVPVEASPDATLLETFHRLHELAYGHRSDDPVQVVHFRLRAIGAVEKPELKSVGHGDAVASSARKATREIYSRERRQSETWPIYDRALLLAGNRVTGPAIVEEPSSTTVLEPGDRLEVDALGNLVIEL